jgi:hypothetical protein
VADLAALPDITHGMQLPSPHRYGPSRSIGPVPIPVTTSLPAPTVHQTSVPVATADGGLSGARAGTGAPGQGTRMILPRAVRLEDSDSSMAADTSASG